MNFAGLKTDLRRRGFEYLTDSVVGQYINDAYQIDICEQRDWLFLRSAAVENGPIDIPDLRSVLYVLNQTSQTKLTPLQEHHLTDMNVDLATPGESVYYYFSTPTTVVPYPLSEAQLQVVYIKVPAGLAGDTDEPIIDDRWHTLITDAAVARAYEDDDEWDAAGVASERFEKRLQAMVQSDALPQHDRPDDFVLQVGELP